MGREQWAGRHRPRQRSRGLSPRQRADIVADIQAIAQAVLPAFELVEDVMVAVFRVGSNTGPIVAAGRGDGKGVGRLAMFFACRMPLQAGDRGDETHHQEKNQSQHDYPRGIPHIGDRGFLAG